MWAPQGVEERGEAITRDFHGDFIGHSRAPRELNLLKYDQVMSYKTIKSQYSKFQDAADPALAARRQAICLSVCEAPRRSGSLPRQRRGNLVELEPSNNEIDRL